MKIYLWAYVLCFIIVGCRPDHQNPPDHQPTDQSPVIAAFNPASATAGTEVTISGENFDRDKTKNTVKFNGTEATVTNATATELKVTVPAGATTGKITVTAGGKTATSFSNFTVVQNQPNEMTISGFDPLSGPVGTEVTLSGANFGNDVVVKVNGVIATITLKSSTSIKFTIPDGLSATEHSISVSSNSKTLNATKNFSVIAALNYHWGPQLSTSQLDKVYSGSTGFIFNNTIYLGLGDDISSTPIQHNNSFWSYDMVSGHWNQAAQLPNGFDMRTKTLSVTYNNKVYVGLGTGKNDWWVLENPADNNSWRLLTPFPLTTYNDKAFAFVVNNNLYVAGVKGAPTGMQPTVIYQFHPADNGGLGRWEEIKQINYAIYNTATLVIGNDVYFGGDLDLNSNSRPYYKFSPVSNEVLLLTSVPGAFNLGRHNAFTLNNKGYVFADNKVYEFTPTASGATWRVALDNSAAPDIKYCFTAGGRAYGIDMVGHIYEFQAL